MRISTNLAAAATLATITWLAGCSVHEHTNGDAKDVKIATPFGGIHVNTDSQNVPKDIGLAVYPGATLAHNDNNHGSADVHLAFGGFEMRVQAATYRSTDSPSKVEAFYREALKAYGDVIACRGDRSIGIPTQTAEGLTCSSSGRHGNVEDAWRNAPLSLKAGSRERQHIVGIQNDGSGTKFGLVALDLPGSFSSGDGKDRQ